MYCFSSVFSWFLTLENCRLLRSSDDVRLSVLSDRFLVKSRLTRFNLLPPLFSLGSEIIELAESMLVGDEGPSDNGESMIDSSSSLDSELSSETGFGYTNW
ncbi:hypothetical protein OGAPHI_002491 [Ogataea philodendri]|uniref:Uncharacterized protein n=1 Tax=Ogataea philodendri TaxID=1378263 RepID=A0A9P8T884_9ASCO|nr:uncharacterized protein OGAPHI_002491 [Ogataea philodendri]KAH3668736.1 hypothetical protein OGAPHI_002491 [Ogataea philodendri]